MHTVEVQSCLSCFSIYAKELAVQSCSFNYGPISFATDRLSQGYLLLVRSSEVQSQAFVMSTLDETEYGFFTSEKGLLTVSLQVTRLGRRKLVSTTFVWLERDVYHSFSWYSFFPNL